MPTPSKRTLLALPSISHSWHEAWNIFYPKFWTFVGIAVIPQIITTAAIYLMSWVVVGDVNANQSLSGLLTWRNPIFIIEVIGVLLLIIFQIFSAVAIVLAATKRGNVQVVEAFDQAKSFVWSFFLSGVLAGLISAVVVILGFFLIAPLYIILAKLQPSNFLYWFSSLLVIPYGLSLLVLVKFVLSGVIVVAEKKRAVESLKRSSQLVKGQFWHMALRLLLIYALAFSIIFGAGYVPYVGGLLATALVVPFLAIYHVVLFEELKAIHT